MLAPRIPQVSLPRRAAFATTTEISATWPSADGGGPHPSRLRPMPGAATCTTTAAPSTATATAGPAAFRFAVSKTPLPKSIQLRL